ncbi:hypothetical protein Tco_0014867 [Tanacetum coccineum]
MIYVREGGIHKILINKSLSILVRIISTDKSKITRKQSKASKHGHENQKSSKRSQRYKAEAKSLAISSFMKPQGPILQIPKVIYNLKKGKGRKGPKVQTFQTPTVLTVEIRAPKVYISLIRHEEEIDVIEYQVLTREIEPTLKPLEEIIWENVFCLGGHRDHVPACLCYMLYCVVHSERFNLAYFMTKRMEWVTKQKRLILPYGMLLTRLFKFIIRENPELENESYVLYDRVMTPLAAQLERKPRRDRGTRRGRHSTSSSSAFDQPSSSHLNDDDDDGNDEGTSRASTPSPICYVNSLTNQVPQVFQNPPNIGPRLEPFYTRQTEIINHQVQLRDEQRGGVSSIEKSLRRLWRNMKK